METKERIIVSIVEDTEQIGKSIKNYINTKSDYCCDHHYLNGTVALEGIASCRPSVVIMDIGLPDMTGVDCMRVLLQTQPDIQFIMFTVFDSDELLFDALKSGASGYLLKDTDPKDIVSAIDDVLKGGGPMSPSIASKVIKSFNNTLENTKIEKLTDHQKNILKHISEGLLNKEIAQIFNITEGTVKVQIRTIYKKLQVNNRVEASILYRDS